MTDQPAPEILDGIDNPLTDEQQVPGDGTVYLIGSSGSSIVKIGFSTQATTWSSPPIRTSGATACRGSTVRGPTGSAGCSKPNRACAALAAVR